MHSQSKTVALPHPSQQQSPMKEGSNNKCTRQPIERLSSRQALDAWRRGRKAKANRKVAKQQSQENGSIPWQVQRQGYLAWLTQQYHDGVLKKRNSGRPHEDDDPLESLLPPLRIGFDKPTTCSLVHKQRGVDENPLPSQQPPIKLAERPKTSVPLEQPHGDEDDGLQPMLPPQRRGLLTASSLGNSARQLWNNYVVPKGPMARGVDYNPIPEWKAPDRTRIEDEKDCESRGSSARASTLEDDLLSMKYPWPGADLGRREEADIENQCSTEHSTIRARASQEALLAPKEASLEPQLRPQNDAECESQSSLAENTGTVPDHSSLRRSTLGTNSLQRQKGLREGWEHLLSDKAQSSRSHISVSSSRSESSQVEPVLVEHGLETGSSSKRSLDAATEEQLFTSWCVGVLGRGSERKIVSKDELETEMQEQSDSFRYSRTTASTRSLQADPVSMEEAWPGDRGEPVELQRLASISSAGDVSTVAQSSPDIQLLEAMQDSNSSLDATRRCCNPRKARLCFILSSLAICGFVAGAAYALASSGDEDAESSAPESDNIFSLASDGTSAMEKGS